MCDISSKLSASNRLLPSTHAERKNFLATQHWLTSLLSMRVKLLLHASTKAFCLHYIIHINVVTSVLNNTSTVFDDMNKIESSADLRELPGL